MGDGYRHPVTPPPELVQQWWAEETYDPFGVAISKLATQAARWGSDQELEACCEWLGEASVVWNGDEEAHPGAYLRADRRPEPPSLKELALAALDDAVIQGDCITTSDALPAIRRALEALPND